MILGGDASNLRAGGGITHLACMLAAASPRQHGFRAVRVWTPAATAARLPPRDWLEIASPAALEGALPVRLAWQRFALPRLARGCDVLFAPGGTAPYAHPRLLAMSQNMLPFERGERRRYGASVMGARLALLERTQASAFRRAAGTIFLTQYAEREVRRRVPGIGRSRVVSHGIEERFRIAPRPPRALADCSPERPLRLLYVSIVDVYKHQWHVAAAVCALRRAGLPVRIRFVGPAYPPALARLERALRELDPRGEAAEYAGPVAHAALPEEYRAAEIAVFASSCENQPNILLEGMAAGLPTACAERGPMPEVLGAAGVYFDPERPDSIAAAIERLARDAPLRERLARDAAARTAGLTWEACAERTFAFAAELARGVEPVGSDPIGAAATQDRAGATHPGSGAAAGRPM
jgi:glycosyltransferase involved in cell wall biosynthesis